MLLKGKMLIKTAEKQDVIHILILLTIALGIGIYLIGTTVVIAKDGITFIEYAKNIEIHPQKTMLEQDQHPGYPAMILGAHKIASLFIEDDSVFSWIYSAQSIAMVFRLLAIIVLYFIGKNLVGAKFSFWAVLILIFLPKPAWNGSDALSDWPHIFFLAVGMLLLIRGAISKKWWMFGLAGAAGGAGYLIRPECIQVIVYGLLWLSLQLFWPKHIVSKSKTALALVLLLIGFCVLAGPYIKLKGAVFPKKKIVQLQPQVVSETTYTADVVPSDIGRAFGKLFANIGETLMWFFVPALFIGLYKSFNKPDRYDPKRFFIIVLVGLNIALMVLLYCKAGYMSGRHTLPLVVFTVFYIPSGLHIFADLLNKKFFKKGNANSGFMFLMTIGIVICSPKLFRPLHQDKLIFRKAAQWLAENTQPNDVIAVPDVRISFYSARKWADDKHSPFSQNPQYVVRVSKKQELTEDKKLPLLSNLLFTDQSDSKYRIDIYKPLN